MNSNLTKGEWDTIRQLHADGTSRDLAHAILKQKVMGNELDMYRALFILDGYPVKAQRATNQVWSLQIELIKALSQMAPWI